MKPENMIPPKYPHKITCRCDTCKLMMKNIMLLREWRAELDGACVADDRGVCVGCINCALEPRPQREPVPVECPF